MMRGTFFLLPERMKCIGDHPFVAACSSNLRIRRGPQALQMKNVVGQKYTFSLLKNPFSLSFISQVGAP